MTLGLRNAAQTFQRFMDEVLQDLDFCYVYIDDILIASATPEEHLRHLEIIFERLKKHGVISNSAKCVFGLPEVKFFRYMVSAAGTKPLPDKVDTIRAYTRPETVKRPRKFLGILNFYRRFLPNAAMVQTPLNNLLAKRVSLRQPCLVTLMLTHHWPSSATPLTSP